jgi:DNA-directed RNA polymerase subunit RPC12/RpoP
MNYNLFTSITPKFYTQNRIECPYCHSYEKREIIYIYKNQMLIRCYHCDMDFEVDADLDQKG